MKFTLLLLATLAAGTLSATTAEECGDLGVMEVPEGADPSSVRKCANHPLGRDRERTWTSNAPIEDDIVKRAADTPAQLKGANIFAQRPAAACYYKSGGGCDGGYCWKACGAAGDGQWCWTAQGDGSGDWLRCSNYSQCNNGAACGRGCKKAGVCGCGC